MKKTMQIIQATINDIDDVALLFDGYRQFYGKPSDVAAGAAFVRERISKQQSVIFLARDTDGTALGFTQLYPTFSSVGMVARWILNDLFVAPQARKQGVASALMQAAEDFAKQSGAKRVFLSTEVDNHAAQALYEKRGWQRETGFYQYSKAV